MGVGQKLRNLMLILNYTLSTKLILPDPLKFTLYKEAECGSTQPALHWLVINTKRKGKPSYGLWVVVDSHCMG